MKTCRCINCGFIFDYDPFCDKKLSCPKCNNKEDFEITSVRKSMSVVRREAIQKGEKHV